MLREPNAVNIRTNNINRFTWSRFARYHNVSWVEERLISIHNVEKRYHHFVRKQAIDISFCIRQAQEYFKAGSKADSSVSPLLIYYGVTSLATALILFLKDGNYRVSKIRENYGSHGLKFSLADSGKSPNMSDLGAKEDGRGLYQLFRSSIGGDYILGTEKKILQAEM